MVEILKNFLENNQLATGGLFVLFSGSALALFWRGYGYITRFFNYLFFVNIDFTSIDQDSFLPIQAWLFNQPYTKTRCSNLMVRHISKDNNNESEDEKIFIPSYGLHYFFHGWRPTILSYTKVDSKSDGYQIIEYISINIFCLFGKLKFAENLVRDSVEAFKTNCYNETFIYTSGGGYESYWSTLLKKKIRQHPVLSSPTEYSELVEDLRNFIRNEKWYQERGINYKRGYLFAGPPGNGKTSCILALAQTLKKHVCLLNLSNTQTSDSQFIKLVTSLPKNSILAIEDLTDISQRTDTKNNNNKKEKAVSLTTILNTLDGLLTPDNLIFFITTNHPESLDEALKRPGRIDVYKNFDNANEYQCRTLFRRFLSDSSPNNEDDFVKDKIGKSMAFIENELIKLNK